MNKQKFCSFYASYIHLVTMLLPYINEKIKENKEFITIFETDISESAKKVIESVNLKEFESQKLIEIGWNNKINIDGTNFENKIVLVMGSDYFIENMNLILDKKEENFTIINCFECIQIESKINDILDSHEKVINTSGENEIEKVFTEYTKRSNRKITIMK